MVFGGVEVEHEVEHHLLHFVGTAVVFVDLVDDHHGFQPHLDGFLQHETCLRHRAFKSVDKQQAAVGHVEHTFHLAAEVGVSRGVDDVDFSVLVIDGNVLGEDCYAAFSLQVVIVEDKLPGVLVFPEEVAGQEHFVDQGCFSVVDMRYNGDVADVLHL